jgi:excisionase family DNA binding protein
MDSNSLLTIKQVAKYLQVVPITVYRMIDRGDLKASKVGRVWRIRYQDVQEYLERSEAAQRGTKE